MNLHSFADELTKLASAGELQLGVRGAGSRAPLNSLGVLLRRALRKRASDLSALHDEVAPPAQDVDPADAASRLPDVKAAPSTVGVGSLGAITPSANPIDKERFNRVWNQAPR
jgi:hypothetical protein